MKKAFFASILILIMIIPSFSQIRIKRPATARTRVRPAIVVTGNVVYYEFPNYTLWSEIKFIYNNNPMKRLRVYFNKVPLKNLGNGTYKFLRNKYRMRLGNELVLYAESRNDPTSPFRGKVEVARYKINNVIRWIYPRRNQTIDLSTSPQNIQLKWNFVNYSGGVRLMIIVAPASVLLTPGVTGGQYSLATNLLTPSTIYHMHIQTAQNGTLGYFDLSKYVHQGSKIRFEYKGGIKFRTK